MPLFWCCSDVLLLLILTFEKDYRRYRFIVDRRFAIDGLIIIIVYILLLIKKSLNDNEIENIRLKQFKKSNKARNDKNHLNS